MHGPMNFKINCTLLTYVRGSTIQNNLLLHSQDNSVYLKVPQPYVILTVHCFSV
jgi:hypothetical protein